MKVYSRPTGLWHKPVIENTDQELRVLILHQLCVITTIVAGGVFGGFVFMIHFIATR